MPHFLSSNTGDGTRYTYTIHHSYSTSTNSREATGGNAALELLPFTNRIMIKINEKDNDK